MKSLIKRILLSLGYELKKHKKENLSFSPLATSFNEIDYKVLEEDFFEIYELCHKETMTSIDKLYSLYVAVNYILDNKIKGDFVECGVWRGGSAMLIAEVLKRRNVKGRRIYLYDTYSGMTEPAEQDVHIYSGLSAMEISERDYNGEHSKWCNASIDIVKQNMVCTGYPSELIHYIEGKVEDTIPNTLPSNISLLRLDTDFYESTLHELVYLYPLLTNKGIVLFDDYGFWEGQKIAVDKYFSENNIHLLMHRIDYSGRIALKT